MNNDVTQGVKYLQEKLSENSHVIYLLLNKIETQQKEIDVLSKNQRKTKKSE